MEERRLDEKRRKEKGTEETKNPLPTICHSFHYLTPFLSLSTTSFFPFYLYYIYPVSSIPFSSTFILFILRLLASLQLLSYPYFASTLSSVSSFSVTSVSPLLCFYFIFCLLLPRYLCLTSTSFSLYHNLDGSHRAALHSSPM